MGGAKRTRVEPVRVYLAGKVQGEKWNLIRDIPRHIAHIYSSDGGNHSEHLSGMGLFELGIEDHKDFVKEESLDGLDHSEAIVAYFDCPTSYGSIAELAWASAKGKDCYVFVNEEHYEEEESYAWPLDSFFDAYWFVCAFPGVKTKVVATQKEAKSLVWSLIFKKYHKKYLQSQEWSKLKTQALSRANYKCQLCNARNELHIHHRTYNNIGNEDLDDLIVLCRKCHEKFHDTHSS